jgi:FtsP/CotA-like multicopper oxidase with cupredoxin domain
MKAILRITLTLTMLLALPLAAQQQQQLAPKAPNAPANSIQCLKTFQPLQPLDVLQSSGGILKGNLYTVSEQVRMTQRSAGVGSDPYCYPQWVRAYRKDPPASWNPSSQTLTEPTPGPLLRARVGELVQLTFVNVIDASKFPLVDDDQCDYTTKYSANAPNPPNPDTYPDCFAGSVWTNVHYHGTHTNPNSTGDNVFLLIKPSPRATDGTNAPLITPADYQQAFTDFFTQCSAELANDPSPKVWPRFFMDIPSSTQTALMSLVQKYDQVGYAANQKAIKQGQWPQYYESAYPYCFKLPNYTQNAWPPAVQAATQTPHTHGAGAAEKDEAQDPQRPLVMGQAPGTHWYHAHKHGSTTINVMNGMTGVFIIEGEYDDDINAFYGANWTRTQPVMVINQLATTTPLQGAGGGPGPDLSVNGRLRPVVNMKGNEVQMWRIADTSGRSGIYFPGPPAGMHWMQLAQDGVQFNNANYQASKDIPIVMASGNRVDLLVKAPPYNSAKGANNAYDLMVYQTVDPSDRPPANSAAVPVILLRVVVGPNAPSGPSTQFLPQAPTFPPFLADIKKSDVQGTKTLTYASSQLPPPGTNPFPSQHTIDGKKFDGEVGAAVSLNKVEEWKIVNATYPPSTGNQISHPFHIHINPFQIFELFDPNDVVSTSQGPGTVSIGASTSTVTGTGTSFSSSFVIGDFIWINGLAPAVVTAIASDKEELTINFTTKAANNIQNATYTVAVPLYTVNAGTQRSGQCLLDANNPDTWKPCTNMVPQMNAIWWDVFPIPSGNIFYSADGKTQTPIPGYFKMRSRFVDYYGDFVTHCHILAHEDRGMMTVVRVVPLQTPMSHH